MTKEEKYIELYKIFIEEESNAAKDHHTRIAFYSGLITATIAATVTGFFKANSIMHFLVLLIGPVTIMTLAYRAKKVPSGWYDRFLCAITSRAKIEQLLGLTVPIPVDKDLDRPYWINEPIVAEKYMSARTKNSDITSHQWYLDHIDTGYNKEAKKLFCSFYWFGAALLMTNILVIIYMSLKA